VDVPGGELRSHSGERTTKITSRQEPEGRLLLQGVGEIPWSLTVDTANGELSGAAVGDGVVFALFGSCTRP